MEGSDRLREEMTEVTPAGKRGQMSKITRHARRLSQSRFLRNVAMVATGTAGVQVIGALFAPLLTRQYGPAAYGALGAFMAMAAVFTNIAGLTYPVAIVLPAKDSTARKLALLSFLLAAAVAGGLTIALWISRQQIAEALGLVEVTGLVLLLPLAVLLITILSVSRQWLIRKQRFSIIATAGVGHALIANSLKAAVGVVAPSATALVAIGALAPGLYILLLSRGLRDLVCRDVSTQFESVKNKSLRKLWGVAQDYRDFPMYRAPQHLVNSFGIAIPMLLLASTFGAEAAGYYAITQTVMGLPSMLIGKSVSDVFYPRVTESIRAGRSAHRELIKTTSALFAIGLIPFGLIVLAGPPLFEIVFGSGWEQSGHYARWLAPLFLLNLVNKPSVAAIAPLGLQGKLLIYEILNTAAKCCGFLLGFFWFEKAIVAVALFSIAGSIGYIALIFYVAHVARRMSK